MARKSRLVSISNALPTAVHRAHIVPAQPQHLHAQKIHIVQTKHITHRHCLFLFLQLHRGPDYMHAGPSMSSSSQYCNRICSPKAAPSGSCNQPKVLTPHQWKVHPSNKSNKSQQGLERGSGEIPHYAPTMSARCVSLSLRTYCLLHIY